MAVPRTRRLPTSRYERVFDYVELYGVSGECNSAAPESSNATLQLGAVRDKAQMLAPAVTSYIKHGSGQEKFVFGRTTQTAAETVASLYRKTAVIPRELMHLMDMIGRTPAFVSAVTMTLPNILRGPPEFRLAKGNRWHPQIERVFAIAYENMIRQALPMLWKYGFVVVLLFADPGTKLILPRVPDMTLFDVHVFTNPKTAHVTLKLFNRALATYTTDAVFFMSDTVDSRGVMRSYAQSVAPTFLVMNARTAAALRIEEDNQTGEVFLQQRHEAPPKDPKNQETGIQMLARYSRMSNQPGGSMSATGFADCGTESVRARMMAEDNAAFSSNSMFAQQPGADLISSRRIATGNGARVLHVVSQGYEIAKAPERPGTFDVSALHSLFDTEVAKTIGFDPNQFSASQKASVSRNNEDIRRRQLDVYKNARAHMEQLCKLVWEDSYGTATSDASHAELVRQKTREVLVRHATSQKLLERDKRGDVHVIEGEMPLTAEELARQIEITDEEYQQIVSDTSVQIVLSDVLELDLSTIERLVELGALQLEDGRDLMRQMCGLGSYYQSGKAVIIDPVEAKHIALQERSARVAEVSAQATTIQNLALARVAKKRLRMDNDNDSASGDMRDDMAGNVSESDQESAHEKNSQLADENDDTARRARSGVKRHKLLHAKDVSKASRTDTDLHSTSKAALAASDRANARRTTRSNSTKS